MSNTCVGIDRGQMTVVNDHFSYHKHVQKLYEELLKDMKDVTIHSQPASGKKTVTAGFALCVREWCF